MLEMSPEGFSLDGRPLRLLSGALHYFRTLPEQWPHRLRMLRAMGLNTVETYVPWNLHEPRPGAYDFDGIADLDGFLRASAEAGLHAIVRPSPYICAEWENGGLPWWLLADRNLRLRVADPRYLDRVDRWYDRLIPMIAAHQTTRGGNVLMVQMENEYGSFGTDSAYLEHLADGLRSRGIDVPLFTSDGPEDFFLTGGAAPGHLATVNFGSRATEAFGELRRFRPRDPAMCMEFWNGWFDHWGEKHTVRSPEDAAGALREILENDASVNLYMAHGGTNFGTWAGANTADPRTGEGYQPTITSYDYDAPIDERGAPTPKFWAFREVLAAYAEQPAPDPEPMPPLLAPARIELTESVPLFDVIGRLSTGTVHSPVPPSFEELGLAHGLVLYRSSIPGPRKAYPLTLEGLADRAHIFVDGVPAAVLERDGDERPEIAVTGPAARLELLVESMGRVNYGAAIGDRKGVSGVLHTQQYLHGWTAEPVPLGDGTPDGLPWRAAAASSSPAPAAFHRGFLDVDEPADGYLALPGWTKGYVWINGFCLGRYWDRGPQRTLYVPWPLLRPGRNEIAVLELDGHAGPFVEIRTEPDLG
ncbi:glycoside hydrolase family 35 protein [Streptomyces sp. RKAG337]|uniref:glycoside hydrolase family 35 protein n=1 Tax=Streptomyces sp. RKAG337 TaxID=2893404 RepID=UPI002033B3F0|nr:beta-galactosidase family protein [Streptomyces sp. RKAG337]MCM2425946.1 beta-galactosidase [Streptomyces sp. RKAG337]